MSLRPVFEVLRAAEAAHKEAVRAQEDAVRAVWAYKQVLDEMAETLGFKALPVTDEGSGPYAELASANGVPRI
jgi:hypothetical protein